jgi:predicted HicB family RNase H-like nuclease
MATMQYRNFLAIIEYDPQIDSFHGRVINATPITFYGKSTEELKQEFARSVEDYFKFCQEIRNRADSTLFRKI